MDEGKKLEADKIGKSVEKQQAGRKTGDSPYKPSGECSAHYKPAPSGPSANIKQ